MSWRTNRAVLRLRNFGRALGVNRLLGSVFGRHGYENRFQAAMLAAIRPGDVVWDVGANIGLYSKQFSALTGSAGKVFAYEPSPSNLKRLQDCSGSLINVTILPLALGEHEGVAVFEQGDDPLGATSRIVDKAYRRSEGLFEVQLSSGDCLISSGVVASPNVVKIDTEGFELDVLLGLRNTLQEKSLRVLCIEMHFGLLNGRGLSDAPAEIEKLLRSSGFNFIWPDASHIVATRIA